MEEVVDSKVGEHEIAPKSSDGSMDSSYARDIKIGSNEKVHLKKLEFENVLAGEYDEYGGYKIKQEYLEELVQVQKKIKEQFEDRYYAVAQNSNFAGISLKFSIVISEEGKQKVATLSLLEEVDDVSQAFKKTLSTTIAKYRDDNDIYFFSKIKKIFNLVANDDTIENNNEKFVPLLLKSKANKLSIKHWLEKFSEEIDELYVKKMLSFLKSSGIYGEVVMKNLMKLKLEKGEGFLVKGSPLYYKRLAMMLDISLLKARTFSISPEMLAQLKEIQHQRNEKFLNVFGKTYSPLQLEKPNQKEVVAKSSSGGSSGGGGKKGGKSSSKSDSSSGSKKKSGFSRKVELDEESSSDELEVFSSDGIKSNFKTLCENLKEITNETIINKGLIELTNELLPSNPQSSEMTM